MLDEEETISLYSIGYWTDCSCQRWNDNWVNIRCSYPRSRNGISRIHEPDFGIYSRVASRLSSAFNGAPVWNDNLSRCCPPSNCSSHSHSSSFLVPYPWLPIYRSQNIRQIAFDVQNHSLSIWATVPSAWTFKGLKSLRVPCSRISNWVMKRIECG
jgi:hypothetical protein